MSKKNGKDKANGGGTIALNKRARHEYHFDRTFEAGLALQGWELKAIRAGRANIGDAYAVVLQGELFLFGAQITPLIQASTHVVADDRRTRKLLLHRHEIDTLIGRVQRDGYTLVPDRAVLEGQQGEGRAGAGQGQADPRQARSQQGARLEPREAARDAPAQQGRLIARAAARASVQLFARGKRTNGNGRHWGDRLRVLRRLPIPKVASPRGFEPRSQP